MTEEAKIQKEESPTCLCHVAEWAFTAAECCLTPCLPVLFGGSSGDGDKHTFRGLYGWGCNSWKTFQCSEQTACTSPGSWRLSQALLMAASPGEGMERRKSGQWGGKAASGEVSNAPLLCPQLVKKVAQSGDTVCLQHTLDIFRQEDLKLLRDHCHTRALSILRARPGVSSSEVHTREAVAYLSLAIFAASRHSHLPPGIPSPAPDAWGAWELRTSCSTLACVMERPQCGHNGAIYQGHLVLESLAVQ